MSTSPKRKSETPIDTLPEPSKRLRTSDTIPNGDNTANTAAPPDALIDSQIALSYWSSTEASLSGILGGYPQVSRIDLQGSKNFFAKLRRQSPNFPPGKKLRRAVDCGAGIGRITKGFLTSVAEVVDIVEPVKNFTDQVGGVEGVGEIYNVGLEEWYPDHHHKEEGLALSYDLIWNQWCLGQLKDAQLVDYLRRVSFVLSEGGWIVVKENLSTAGEDVFDDTDSSVTRTDEKFRALFAQAGLRVVGTELQRGMLEGLYPVRAYALQPK